MEIKKTMNSEMATVEIINIEQEKISQDLWGYRIEEPVVGHIGHNYHIKISGWILSKIPGPLNIEISHDGVVLRNIPVNQNRHDVAKIYPSVHNSKESGFSSAIGLIGLPLKSTTQIFINVILSDQKKILIGIIDLKRLNSIKTDYAPTLKPIVLNCMGRSGTTWIMRLLGEHPNILVAGGYPYEILATQYWLHLVKVLSEPANTIESTPPLHSFQQKLNWIGHHPSYQLRFTETASWFGQDYQKQLLKFCQQSIDSFYSQIASSKEKLITHKNEYPIYFVEKYHTNYSLDILDEMYPDYPEILLVRDFRDVLCSQNAFFGRKNKHLQNTFFNKNVTPNDQILEMQKKYINDFTQNSVIPILHRWRKYRDKIYLVHYEDIVLFPEETLTSIYRYLGLKHTPEIVLDILKKATADVDMLNKHKTSSDPKASIGRWQSDLSDIVKSFCMESLGEALEEFGYTQSIDEQAPRKPFSHDIQRELNKENIITNNICSDQLDKYEQLLTQYENKLKNFEKMIN